MPANNGLQTVTFSVFGARAWPAPTRPFYIPTTSDMLTQTTFFKCLADETRLRCLMLLFKEGRLCVCELTQALDVLQPKISRHLGLLRQSGLLLDSREGQWVYYQINPDLPDWAVDILKLTAEQVSGHLTHQDDCQRLQAITNRVGCCV